MKKILSIACIALVVAALASCKKTYVTASPQNQTWVSRAIVASDWAQTRDGKADSVDVPIDGLKYDFYSDRGATLTYFSLVPNVWEQVPEVYNGISYSYIHYIDNGQLHVVLYSQPVNGGTPVKPVDPITLKLVLLPSEFVN